MRNEWNRVGRNIENLGQSLRLERGLYAERFLPQRTRAVRREVILEKSLANFTRYSFNTPFHNANPPTVIRFTRRFLRYL